MEDSSSRRPKLDPSDALKFGPEAALRSMTGGDDDVADGSAAKGMDKLRPNKKAKHLLK